MKKPTTGELLKILKDEELLDFACCSKLPPDFSERRSKLHRKDPKALEDARHLKALRLGVDWKAFTRSKKKWRLTSVVLLIHQLECLRCKSTYSKIYSFMIKSQHPYYGVHIASLEPDTDYSDYSDLPLESYTRNEKVNSCSQCSPLLERIKFGTLHIDESSRSTYSLRNCNHGKTS